MRTYKVLVGALLVGWGLVSGATLAAEPAGERSAILQVDIPSQDLHAALQQLALTSHHKLFYRSELVAGKVSPAVKGNLTTSAAVQALLAGTDLTFEIRSGAVVWISEKKGRKISSAAEDRRDALLAEAEQGTGIASMQRLAAVSDEGSETRAPAIPEEESRGIPEMLVKGNRTSNIDIQRTIDDVQPYVVFTAEDIERSMTGSLDQFLMAQLPMNTSNYTANVPSDLPLNGNVSSINLRGLGANQTLILVNGRRMPGVGTSSALLQTDINGIPMSSVARIEVLPSTAGGIYGGGATGGVINIILKNDYKGVEVNARYDGTFRRDAASRVLEASAGFSLEGGKTTIMLSGSHQDSIPLMHGDRDFAIRARTQLLRNNPAVYTGTNIPLGNTANIRSVNGQPLVLASTNQSIGSAFTHVPYGYAGPASDGGAALAANAGRYNMDISTGPQGLDRSLAGAPSVDSLRLNIRRSFTERIEAFIDASQSMNDSEFDYGNAPYYNSPIAARTANNPFTTPITVYFPANDYSDGALVTTSDMLNVTGGVIVRLPRNWTLQGEYGRGYSERTYGINQQNGGAAFGTMVQNGTLSVLRDVAVYPQDYSVNLGGVEFTGFQPDPLGANLENMTLRAAGPTFSLPAGPVMLSALLEQRTDEVDGSISGSINSAFVVSYNYTPPRKQTTEGAYAELTAPLISAANALPLVRALDLQLSYRKDRIGSRTVTNTSQGSFPLSSPDAPLPEPEYFTNHVEANQYTVGLRYQPIESLALRVSNSVGVLPPSLSQLVPLVRFNINTTTADPQRNDTPIGVVAELRSSGNVDLLPEQSDSWSAGAIFTPAFLPGFRLSVDYTRIEKTDEISTISTVALLENESIYPDRIRRLPLTDADRLQNFDAGRISYLDTGNVNIAHTNVEALDFRAGYQWTTRHGIFRADAVATHQLHLQKQLLSTTAVTEYMGFFDGPLEWRGNAGITWDRGAWTLGWNTQYFDSFPIYSTTTTATSRATITLNNGADFVPHQIYHDLSFKYRMEDAPFLGGLFANSEMLVGISNVLDTEPPLMVWTSNNSVIPATTTRYGDPRLRRYSISLRKSFR